LLPRGLRGQCPGSEGKMKKNHDLPGTVESAQSWSHQKKRFVTEIFRLHKGVASQPFLRPSFQADGRIRAI
jgi:hypothetical protein